MNVVMTRSRQKREETDERNPVVDPTIKEDEAEEILEFEKELLPLLETIL